jgi:replicative DNA helicase
VVEDVWDFSATGTYQRVPPPVDRPAWSELSVKDRTPQRVVASASVPLASQAYAPPRYTTVSPQAPPPPPAPEPLPSMAAPPPFPIEALPTVIREMVKTVARNKRVPVDLVALQALSAAAALTGPRAIISRRRDWTEPLILHCLTAMESGSGKSPATANVIGPLYSIQAEMEAAHQKILDERDEARQARIREIEDQLFVLPRKDTMIVTLNEEKARIEAESQADAEAIPTRLLFSPDITPEALSSELGHNGGWGSIFDSEGVFFANLAGRYSGGRANLTVALKAYDADYIPGGGRITRKQEPIPRAVLSLGLSVQPGVFADTLDNPAMDEQGFAARFLLAVPASMLGRREVDPPGLDHAALSAWRSSLERLAALPIPDYTPGHPFPVVMELSPNARRMHVEYEATIEPRLSPLLGDIGQMTGWGGKHLGRILRIAGILHLIAGREVDQPVDEQVMRAALKIGNWSIEHALLASTGLAARTDGPNEAATDARCMYLIQALRQAKAESPDVWSEPVRFREIQRKVRAKWANAEAITLVLDQLVDRGWMERGTGADRRGRPVVTYLFNDTGGTE